MLFVNIDYSCAGTTYGYSYAAIFFSPVVLSLIWIKKFSNEMRHFCRWTFKFSIQFSVIFPHTKVLFFLQRCGMNIMVQAFSYHYLVACTYHRKCEPCKKSSCIVFDICYYGTMVTNSGTNIDASQSSIKSRNNWMGDLHLIMQQVHVQHSFIMGNLVCWFEQMSCTTLLSIN